MSASLAILGRCAARSAFHCATVARYCSFPPRVAALRRNSREMVEGFFGRLKTELFYPRDWKFTTVEQLIKEVNSYIHGYNEKRIKLFWVARPYQIQRESWSYGINTVQVFIRTPGGSEFNRRRHS